MLIDTCASSLTASFLHVRRQLRIFGETFCNFLIENFLKRRTLETLRGTNTQLKEPFMSAHIKPVRGCHTQNMRQIESKISALQPRYQQLAKQRQEEIASLLTSLNLAALEDNTLLGGLLFLKDKVTTQDPMVGGWRDAGSRFLRRRKSKTLSSFATDAVPQKANCTPQKHLGEREV